jgi:hypothetical protein
MEHRPKKLLDQGHDAIRLRWNARVCMRAGFGSGHTFFPPTVCRETRVRDDPPPSPACECLAKGGELGGACGGAQQTHELSYLPAQFRDAAPPAGL